MKIHWVFQHFNQNILSNIRLTSKLRRFVQKRAKIEKNYSKDLRDWVKYCGTVLDKGIVLLYNHVWVFDRIFWFFIVSFILFVIYSSDNLRLSLFETMWIHIFIAGPEYGTTRYALKGIIAEAECLSEVHSRVETRLNCGEFQELGVWQQCSYTPVWLKKTPQIIFL